MRFPLRLALALSLSLSSALAAAPATSERPIRGTLNMAIGAEPATLSPIAPEDAYGVLAATWVLESLFRRDPETAKWVPALALKHEVSRDGLQFTFRLRPGVSWHDGKPFTSEDVRFTFEVYRTDRFPLTAYNAMYAGIESIETPDPLTIKFRMKEKLALNLALLAEKPVFARHIYGEGDPKDPRFRRELIGTGAYKLVAWERGQKITYARNRSYWGDGVDYYRRRNRFEKLSYRMISDALVRIELLKAGELDVTWLAPEQFANLEKERNAASKYVLAKVSNDGPATGAFGMIAWNPTHRWFKDARFRLAMSHLVNRELMLEKFGHGMLDLAVGTFGNRNPGTSPAVKPVPFSPPRALELLKELGWKLSESGLTRETGEGTERLEFTILCTNDGAERQLTMIREDAARIGVRVNVRRTEFGNMIKLAGEGKYEGMVFGFGGGSREPEARLTWHSKSKSFMAGYANPELDRLIEQAEGELDEGKRFRLYRKVHEKLAADQPVSFLFSPKYELYATSKRIGRLKDTYRYEVGIDTWWIESEP